MQLSNSFCRTLPHYDPQLQFVIGLCIAGDLIAFVILPLGGGAAGFQLLASFNLSTRAHQLQCVHAAVNVGRWCRHATAVGQELVSPVAHPFGRTDSDARRDVTLMRTGEIVKVYHQLAADQRKWLKFLYEHIAVEAGAGGLGRVPFMEWATRCEAPSRKPATLELQLKPLGVSAEQRPPRDLNELRAALSCVLQCLHALHAQSIPRQLRAAAAASAAAPAPTTGWGFLDVRWANVIFVAPGDWRLIDAEFARPFGQPMPAGIKQRDPHAVVADEAADCYLVGLMMQSSAPVAAIVNTDAQAQHLRTALLAPRQVPNVRTAAAALSHAFFNSPAAAAAVVMVP
jgi:hypothetical protein